MPDRWDAHLGAMEIHPLDGLALRETLGFYRAEDVRHLDRGAGTDFSRASI